MNSCLLKVNGLREFETLKCLQKDEERTFENKIPKTDLVMCKKKKAYMECQPPFKLIFTASYI